MKTVLRVLLIIAGEAFVVLGFDFLFNNGKTDLTYRLNLSVTTFIYFLVILNCIGKSNNRKVLKKPIGEMGILWTFSFFYILSAMGLIIAGHNNLLNFRTLLTLHIVLIFLMLIGIYVSLSSHEYDIKRFYKKQKQ